MQEIKHAVQCVFVFHTPHFFTKKGALSLTSGDLSNLYQHPEDCLQKASVISNDSLILSHDGSTKMPSEVFKRLEILIFDYKVNYDAKRI